MSGLVAAMIVVACGGSGSAAAIGTPRLNTCTAKAAATARRTSGTLARSAKCRRERTQPLPPCVTMSAATSPHSSTNESAIQVQTAQTASTRTTRIVSSCSVAPARSFRTSSARGQPDGIRGGPTAAPRMKPGQQRESSKDKQFCTVAARTGVEDVVPYVFRIHYQTPSLSCGLLSTAAVMNAVLHVGDGDCLDGHFIDIHNP